LPSNLAETIPTVYRSEEGRDEGLAESFPIGTVKNSDLSLIEPAILL